MERPLDTVIDLQKALDELRNAEERLHGIPDWMRELHDEHAAKKEEIDALMAAVEEAASERRAAEGETQDSQEKLENYQEQIGRVRNQREYGALLQEIDGIKGTIKSLEERALAALERQDAAQVSLEELKEGFRDLDERYGTELGKWEAEKPGVAKQVDELKGRITVLRERIPPGSLALFERVLERHAGSALAEIRKIERVGRGQQIWSCGTCHYRVRPQAVVEISNNGSIVFCDSCKRILYIEETIA
jgi:predicted  nucleic acid-binding Zn-ribbon protein